MIVVFVDGLCEPRNPGGTATYGFAAYREGNKVVERSAVVGEGRGMSNNVAEYSALCAALGWLLEQGLEAEEIAVRSDSMLLVNQMSGAWESHGGMYAPYFFEALGLAEKFKSLSFRWIPREENTEADALSRKAYEKHCRARGAEPRYHDDYKRREQSKDAQREAPKPEADTCLTCKWIRYSEPHIGCYRGGSHQKWLPRSYASTQRCGGYEKLNSLQAE